MKRLILIALILNINILFSNDDIHQLITNDETVLTHLIDADVYNKEKICIVDGLTGELTVFDYSTGRQLSSYGLDFYLTDTLAQKMSKIDPQKKWVTIRELCIAKGDNDSPEIVNGLKKFVRHSFNKARFINKNEIIASGTIATNFTYNEYGIIEWGMATIVCVFNINLKDNKIKIIGIDHSQINNSDYYFYNSYFEFQKKEQEILLYVEKFPEYDNISIASFDLNMNFKKVKNYLPNNEFNDEFREYRFDEFLICSENEIITLYQYSPYIYLKGKKIARIKELEDCNIYGKLSRDKEFFLQNIDSLCSFCIFDTDINLNQGRFNILYMDKHQNSKTILSKYTTQGKRISYKEIKKPSKYDSIDRYIINNHNNDVITFYKLNDEYYFSVTEN